MRVLVIFEFEEVNPGSPEEDEIVSAISNECDTMRVAFDAQGCWVQEVFFPEWENPNA